LTHCLHDGFEEIVLYCLSNGTRHFGEMQRRVPGLSKKMLVQVLRALERDGLVKRHVFQVIPPKTDYELTALGRRLYEPIASLCQWAIENVRVLDQIERNRAKHDAQGGTRSSTREKITLVETRLAKRCAAGQGSRVGIEQRAFAQLKIDF